MSQTTLRVSLHLLFVLTMLPCCNLQAADDWSLSEIKPAAVETHPALACTQTELARLKAALVEEGPNRRVVVSMIAAADRAIQSQPEYPPRGGQHNQWYQCDKCQIALKTIDDTHHLCPTCKEVYSGEPYDDVIYARKHNANLSRMTAAAWGYAITGKPQYAEYSKGVLLAYAERYAKYPYHSANRSKNSRSGGHLFEQTLNEAASFSSNIGPAYDLIHDWEGLTPTDHQTIRNGLLLPMLNNIARNSAGKSNWQTWHNAAMLWGGGLLNDAAWTRRAILDPKNGFLYQMQTSVTEDGMWYENSWGYHFYTLSAMIDIAETARRLGIDLWSHPMLKKMFTVALGYVMPTGQFPRFGDDTNTTIARVARSLEFAYHAYQDPAMLPYLPTRPNQQSVEFGRTLQTQQEPAPLPSQLFPGAGHAILRTHGAKELAAAITFGPYGGFHGHYDKLSFVFFGVGQELGYDPGRAQSQAYRLPIHQHWYKATISHNTVIVDQQPQQPATGQPEFFAITRDYAAIVTRYHEGYDGVDHRRLLCLTPDYLLVFDDLQSESEHRYDWLYHHRAKSVTCDVADTPVEQLAKSFPGQEYLRDLKQGHTQESVNVQFVADTCTTHLQLAQPLATTGPSATTTITLGDGVGASVTDRVPLAIATRRGTTVQFAAVLEPVTSKTARQVSTVELERRDNWYRVHIAQGDRVDIVTLAPDGTTTIDAGGTLIPLK